MAISDPTEIFFGKKVQQYEIGSKPELTGNNVYRLSLDYDDEREMSDLIEQFLAAIDKTKLDALIIGMWGEPYDSGADEVLATLSRHAPELPNLRALFVGDMTYEECEISWIVQGNYTPLLAAFPNLELLRIRGGNSLVLEPFEHAHLRQLIIESGGLGSNVAEALAHSRLPALEHLELWLGTDDYGFEGDVDLYQRVVENLRTPALRYLGLRNAQIADELAQWLAGKAWLGQLHTLDLSMGTIGDVGAEALFASPHLQKLQILNLSHHYISAEWQAKLASLPLAVVMEDEQDEFEDDEDGWRYVAVGE